jgi:hypothetical protein
LVLPDGTVTLVSGETRLMASRALGIRPRVCVVRWPGGGAKTAAVDRHDYRANSTKETTPWLIWIDNVLGLAKASHDDVAHFRDRLQRAYQAGEAAWMAADEVQLRLKQKKLHDRGEQDSPKNLLKPRGAAVSREYLRRAKEREDQIPGGRGDLLQPEDVDPAQLALGTDHEMEHTGDRALAQEIALDHLAEDPGYYTHLQKVEGSVTRTAIVKECHKGDGKEGKPWCLYAHNGKLLGRHESQESAYKQESAIKARGGSVVTATLMKIGPGVPEAQATHVLRTNKLTAKNNGDRQSAIYSAGFYAKKLSKTMFVYAGSFYGTGAWRVSPDPHEYLNFANNHGSFLYSVTPDLAVHRHEIDRNITGARGGSILEQVQLGVGEASMCWSETPKGVFDSTRALAIADRLTSLLDLAADSLEKLGHTGLATRVDRIAGLLNMRTGTGTGTKEPGGPPVSYDDPEIVSPAMINPKAPGLKGPGGSKA